MGSAAISQHESSRILWLLCIAALLPEIKRNKAGSHEAMAQIVNSPKPAEQDALFLFAGAALLPIYQSCQFTLNGLVAMIISPNGSSPFLYLYFFYFRKEGRMEYQELVGCFVRPGDVCSLRFTTVAL